MLTATMTMMMVMANHDTVINERRQKLPSQHHKDSPLTRGHTALYARTPRLLAGVAHPAWIQLAAAPPQTCVPCASQPTASLDLSNQADIAQPAGRSGFSMAST